MSRAFLNLYALSALAAWASPVYAYVDPGIIAALYQAGYVLILGAAATFIFRPWAWLKSRFSRRGKSSAGHEPQPEGEASTGEGRPEQ